MPFSSRPRACREPSGHSVSVALPLHIHHPAVEPVLHAPDHPLPPPPRAGLAEGVCAVCVLRWLGPGHRTAFAATGASSANRFVSIGPRDGNFLNIPQQSQPRDPCRPPEAAQFSESPQKRSRRAELCTSSQAESNMQNGLCQAEGRKKERMQPNFLPIPSWPSFRGRNFIPKQVHQHLAEGACPPPLSFLGEPHPQLGSELH
uniref:Nuclear factor I X n=1 Tax=Myotis myotis TaxID=51298 RepID=A0A7J7RBZ4_MYOMY|nr:nuclear factor I X [Myotis myotis]